MKFNWKLQGSRLGCAWAFHRMMHMTQWRSSCNSSIFTFHKAMSGVKIGSIYELRLANKQSKADRYETSVIKCFLTNPRSARKCADNGSSIEVRATKQRSSDRMEKWNWKRNQELIHPNGCRNWESLSRINCSINNWLLHSAGISVDDWTTEWLSLTLVRRFKLLCQHKRKRPFSPAESITPWPSPRAERRPSPLCSIGNSISATLNTSSKTSGKFSDDHRHDEAESESRALETTGFSIKMSRAGVR